MKIWVTKYALTQGITEHEADVSDKWPTMATIAATGPGEYTQHFHGAEWQKTHEAALARADEMRAHEIKRLERRIGKLRKRTF